jgi:hypothetical protein
MYCSNIKLIDIRIKNMLLINPFLWQTVVPYAIIFIEKGGGEVLVVPIQVIAVFKEPCHEIFDLRFLHQTTPSDPSMS